MVVFIVVLIIGFILLFMAMPSLRCHPDRKLLEGLLITHRGLHSDEIPENSIPAFLEAAIHGFAIENDIHITADGEVVVFHDNTLERMCGINRKIEEMTLAEVKECRLKNTNERIPTLKECLSAIDGRVPLLIEFKCDTLNCESLCKAANKILEAYSGKYFIQSFNPAVPTWYRKNKPDVLRGQLAMYYSGTNILKHLASAFLLNFGARPDFVAYDERSAKRPSFVIQKLLGALPVGWTFRSAETMENKKNLFKAYIFENFIPEKK